MTPATRPELDDSTAGKVRWYPTVHFDPSELLPSPLWPDEETGPSEEKTRVSGSDEDEETSDQDVIRERAVEDPTDAASSALETRVQPPDRALLSLPRHRVAGETFYIERQEARIFLRHDQWSLVGEGRTLLEAERDLIAEAKDVAAILLDKPPASLSPEAVELQKFLPRIT